MAFLDHPPKIRLPRPGRAVFCCILGPALAGVALHAQEDGGRDRGLKPSVQTQKNARTFNFTVPAPRGQIVDSAGRVLANNRVRDFVSVRLPTTEGVPDPAVLEVARSAIRSAEAAGVATLSPGDDEILGHYRHRRWLPLRISSRPLTDGQRAKLGENIPLATEPGRGAGIVIEQIYLREYPARMSAGHIVGYAGKKTPLETTEIRDQEILFEDFEGRSGLEKHFDKELTGKDGTLNLTFDEEGKLVTSVVIEPPEPGFTVVTTLNLEVQRLAESVLAEKAKRGAAVVVDASTGDILALASQPNFDPNAFIPFISTDDFDTLNNDPTNPLFGRAFSAAYPPGSTFKPFVACAVLERGPVRPYTTYNGPPSLQIGDRVFKNWNKNSEGALDVVGALARSCNTWFYQAAIDTGSAPIIQTAAQFGFGTPTGLPLAGEASGGLPKELYLRPGNTANISIGQGEILSSPVQLALGTAALANGKHFPRARLVSHIQDYQNQVLRHLANESRGYLPYSQETIESVQKGMDEVVNAGRGTATRARLDTVRVAGKTGTAQWASGDGRRRHLAWFSGFTFTSNPQLAFAVVYEGDYGETVSGGRVAAPIAAAILKGIYDTPLAFGFPEPVPTAPPEPVVAASSPYRGGAVPRATPAVQGSPPPPQPEQPRRSFWRRLFGRP